VNSTLKADDLINNEYVHQALALQALLLNAAGHSWIIDDDGSPIGRWLSKRSLEEREELLDVCVQQAKAEDNSDITINYIKEAADKFGKRENDLTGTDLVFGRPVSNSYYFRVPALGFRGNADSVLASNCLNL
jgi:hypothetical protein